MTQLRHATAVALLVAISGCGNSPNKVTIPRNSSALAAFVAPTTCQAPGLPFGSQSLTILSLLIVANGSLPNVCSLLTDGCTSYANSQYIMLFIENFDQTGATASAVGTGTYQLVQNFNNTFTGTSASAGVAGTSASCNVAENTSGDSSTGTITITDITAISVEGSFDVMVDGTEYQGDLNATTCPPSDFTVVWSGCNENISVSPCLGTTQCLALPPASG